MTDKCTQLNLSGSRRCADSTLTWTQRVPFDKQPKHPRPFSRVEIRTRTASCYLVKICMVKTQLASLVTSARQIVILVPRETHEHPAPPRNASASQHITTSPHQHSQPPTTRKKRPPKQAQQPQQQHTTNNKCTDTRTATPPATTTTTTTATTAASRNTKQEHQQLFHQVASQNAPSPASMPAPAHKKKHGQQQQQPQQKLRHMTSNSMETSSRRHVTQGP